MKIVQHNKNETNKPENNLEVTTCNMLASISLRNTHAQLNNTITWRANTK